MKSSWAFIVLASLFIMLSPLSAQILQPGDGVRIQLYNVEEEVTDDYFIQENGNLQLPFVGTIPTDDRDFQQLQEEITRKYTDIYREPELTVQPLYKIKILGEVRTPGVYFVTGVEHLSDLIALAGGETRDAELKKLHFTDRHGERDIDAREILLRGNRLADVGLNSGVQLYVPRKRWITFRNASTVFSGMALIVTAVSLSRS